MIFTNIYYLPIYCCLLQIFLSWQISIPLNVWSLLSKREKSYCTTWLESHVASVQYIKTASIFSIRTYFWIHQIYFQLAHISSNLVSFSNRIHIYRGWFGPCCLCFKYTQKQKRKQKVRNAVAPIKKRLCV